MIEYESKFFNAKDVLECGQIFRFRPFEKGYFVCAEDKACYVYTEEGRTVIESDDEEYFNNFFDLLTDYSVIYDFAEKSGYPVVVKAAKLGKGVRILRQNKEEMLFSFIVSQNNHIPRIKGCIERMSRDLGEKKSFKGETFYSFPKAESIYKAGEKYFAENAFGYRAGYMSACAESVLNGFDLEKLSSLPTKELKKQLLTLHGVGPKVADCISLFGYHRTDSFPVDTWIEKLYREDFGGTLKDRNKITDFFLDTFGENSGYVQQYIFYYKRSLEQ